MKISELKVMRSNAGYYIGRSCVDLEDGDFEQPYSRESGYYASSDEAQKALDSDNFFRM